mmetsp:Transcript_48423/g.113005  ORF Transcript_48423/g.113005 Transcript_48423/m.113005 type:complete len:80 (-) Transcript_48423:526-765(-)
MADATSLQICLGKSISALMPPWHSSRGHLSGVPGALKQTLEEERGRGLKTLRRGQRRAEVEECRGLFQEGKISERGEVC